MASGQGDDYTFLYSTDLFNTEEDCRQISAGTWYDNVSASFLFLPDDERWVPSFCETISSLIVPLRTQTVGWIMIAVSPETPDVHVSQRKWARTKGNI